MKKTDKLPHLIAGVALIIYLVFLFSITRESENEPLESGNIQKAIETGQYR